MSRGVFLSENGAAEEARSCASLQTVSGSGLPRWSLAVRFAAGIGLCVCLYPFINGRETLESLSRLSWEGFLLAFLCFLAGSVPAAAVWSGAVRLTGFSLSFPLSWRLSLVGFFWNNVVPGGVAGDAVRVFELRQRGVPVVKGTASVFIERWSALAALIISAASAWCLSLSSLEAFDEVLRSSGSIPSGAFSIKWSLLAVVVLMAAVFAFGTAVLLSRRLNTGLREKMLKRVSLGVPLAEFAEEIMLVRDNRMLFACASAVNLLAPFFEALAVYAIFCSVCAEPVPFIYFLVFIPVFRIMLHLPISVNGIGTQEAAFVLYWSAAGISPDVALAVSILTHVVKLAMCVLGALLSIMQGKRDNLPSAGQSVNCR